MATASISLVGLLILLLVIGLPVLVVLGLVFAVIKRKRLGAEVVALALVAGAILTVLLFIGWTTARRIENDFGGMPQVAALSDPSAIVTAPVPAPPTAPTLPAGMPEVASDEELAAVASAQPKIELDSEIVIDGKAADVKSDRPDWIYAHLGDNQKLITSGPFTTKESCELDAQKQISQWLWSRHEELWPSGAGKFPGFGTDVTQAIKSQYEELRDTSVGEMHLLYTLVEVTPEVESQIAKSLAEAAAQVARKRGVRAVSFAGFGVLSLVALTHVVLKSGGRKAKNGAP